MKVLMITYHGVFTSEQSKMFAKDTVGGLYNGVLVFDDTVTYEVIDVPIGLKVCSVPDEQKKDSTAELFLSMINGAPAEEREKIYRLLASYRYRQGANNA